MTWLILHQHRGHVFGLRLSKGCTQSPHTHKCLHGSKIMFLTLTWHTIHCLFVFSSSTDCLYLLIYLVSAPGVVWSGVLDRDLDTRVCDLVLGIWMSSSSSLSESGLDISSSESKSTGSNSGRSPASSGWLIRWWSTLCCRSLNLSSSLCCLLRIKLRVPWYISITYIVITITAHTNITGQLVLIVSQVIHIRSSNIQYALVCTDGKSINICPLCWELSAPYQSWSRKELCRNTECITAYLYLSHWWA